MDRYGEAIEFDLHERHHLDLIDFFRGRHSWRKLHNILGRLPRASAFMQEQLDDPEVVEWVLSLPESDGPSRPSLKEFTPEIEALYGVFDRLGTVIEAVMVASDRKPPNFLPLPRPVTGVERARAEREKRRHLDLVNEVKAAQARWLAARKN